MLQYDEKVIFSEAWYISAEWADVSTNHRMVDYLGFMVVCLFLFFGTFIIFLVLLALILNSFIAWFLMLLLLLLLIAYYFCYIEFSCSILSRRKEEAFFI